MPSLSFVADLLGGGEAERGRAEQARTDLYATMRTVPVSGSGTHTAVIDGASEPSPVTPAVTVHAGDRVVVRNVGHALVVVSNITQPSVTTSEYVYVKGLADTANEILDGMSEVADEADKTLAQIVADAIDSAEGLSDIRTYVGYAEGYTQTLAERVEDSEDLLDDMRDAAEAAGTTLTGIYKTAKDAEASAAEAKVGADTASVYATNALNSLSDVERVVGTLNWITEHGSYVAATEHTPASGAVYYRREGTSPNYSYVVVSSVPDADVPTAWQKTSDTEIDPSKTYYLKYPKYQMQDDNTYVEGTTYYSLTMNSAYAIARTGTPGIVKVGKINVPSGADIDSLKVTSVEADNVLLESGVDYVYDKATRTITLNRPCQRLEYDYDYYKDDTQAASQASGQEYFKYTYRPFGGADYVAVENPAEDGLDMYYEGTSFNHYENDPAMAGLYRLNVDESIQNYIAQHLSLTNDGLWLTGDSVLERMLISSGSDNYDAGMYIMHGGSVVGYYGENAVIGNTAGAHITVGTDSNGNPRIGLWQNASVEVAYISNNELYIERTVVLSAMKIGNWQWTAKASGNLTLQWIGG